VSDLAAIVSRYVGHAWNPPAFDCWAFLRVVYGEAYAIELHTLGHLAGDVEKDVPFAYTEAGSGRWCPLSIPRDGDAVAMGRRARPHHVGIWLATDGGLVAHCAEPRGVTVAPLHVLRAQGWATFQFYRHKGRA
jgi:cell wall-associated NlpC family hydrolase